MQHRLLGLLAQTSIHAGLGKSTGVIDLPIMREAHSHWPCVYGSAMKGALRAKAEQVKLPHLIDIFGPDTNNASDHAGALAVGDARLLLLPVRSLTGHFKWVTCPALLQRAASDAQRLQTHPAPRLPAATDKMGDDKVLLPQAAGEGKLFLEEFSLEIVPADLSAWVTWLGAFGGDALKDRLGAQLAIVSDDLFAHLAQFATPVNAHIAIDNARKTVVGGALWYEETLPPETVLYVALASHGSRKDNSRSDAQMLDAALALFNAANHPYLQIGGNETVGMGWVQVTPLPAAHA